MQFFHDHFPDISRDETKTIPITAVPGMPAIALFEYYCTELACGCQSGKLGVVSIAKPKTVLASVSFSLTAHIDSSVDIEFTSPMMDREKKKISQALLRALRDKRYQNLLAEHRLLLRARIFDLVTEPMRKNTVLYH